MDCATRCHNETRVGRGSRVRARCRTPDLLVDINQPKTNHTSTPTARKMSNCRPSLSPLSTIQRLPFQAKEPPTPSPSLRRRCERDALRARIEHAGVLDAVLGLISCRSAKDCRPARRAHAGLIQHLVRSAWRLGGSRERATAVRSPGGMSSVRCLPGALSVETGAGRRVDLPTMGSR